MKKLITLVMVPLVLCIVGAKVWENSSLNFVGGSCDTCQNITNGANCCDEGAKPTVGQGCTGASGGSESDCNGAVGRACGDSGVEQTKTCDASVTENCIKGYSYTCTGGVWVKGLQNVDCGLKNLCSME